MALNDFSMIEIFFTSYSLGLLSIHCHTWARRTGLILAHLNLTGPEDLFLTPRPLFNSQAHQMSSGMLVCSPAPLLWVVWKF